MLIDTTKLVRKVGGAVLAVTMASADAEAMCPATTLDNQFRGSTTVFTGRVVDRQVVSIPAPPGHATETTFEVEDVWKGPSDKTAIIRTRSFSVEGIESVTFSEDVYFVIGKRYVVFASGQPLQTSACTPTV